MALSNEIIDILADWGKEFEDDLRTNLLKKEKNATKSRLSASIKFKAVVTAGNTFTVQIGINDYYKFVDEGRKAGNVSKQGQDKIGEWAARRGYIGKFQQNNLKQRLEKQAKNKTNRKKKVLKALKFDKAKKQFKYLVSRKIKMKGYKGNNFYSEIINDGRVEALEKILSDTIKREVKLEILKNVNG